ncbi:MAG: hypothetical protein ACFFFT_10265 [Candidatus Thorarchaeota archaeon]
MKAINVTIVAIIISETQVNNYTIDNQWYSANSVRIEFLVFFLIIYQFINILKFFRKKTHVVIADKFR